MASNTTKTIRIIIQEKGAKQTGRKIRDIGKESDASTKALNLLRGALAAVGATSIIRQYVQLSNLHQSLENRIRLVTHSQAQQTAVMRELVSISKDTFTSLRATGELYARLAFNTRQLGLTQNEVLDITRSLNQAVILSGAGAREATNAIIQLSQGFASGTLRGDELRSVLEQLPFVADVIAKGLGVTRDQLRNLAVDGKVTTQAIVDAFKDAAPEIQAQFDAITPTIAQAFSVFQTGLTEFVGNTNKATGLSGILSKALLVLAENVGILVIAIALLSAALAGLILKAVITSIISMSAAIAASVVAVKIFTIAMIALNAVLAVNPIILLAFAITVFITTLVKFGILLRDTTKEAEGLNDAISGRDFEAISKSLSGYRKIRTELKAQKDTLDKQLSTGTLQLKVEEDKNKLAKQLLQGQIVLSKYQHDELNDLVASNAERRISNKLTERALQTQQGLQDTLRQGLRSSELTRNQEAVVDPLVAARVASGLPFDDDFANLLDKIRQSIQAIAQLRFDKAVVRQNKELENQIALYGTAVGLRQNEATIQEIITEAQRLGVVLTEDQLLKTKELLEVNRLLSIDDVIGTKASDIQKANQIQQLKLAGKVKEAEVQQVLNGLLAEGESIESTNLENLKKAIDARQQLSVAELNSNFTKSLEEQGMILKQTTTERALEAQILQRRNEFLLIGADYSATQEESDRKRLELLSEDTRQQQLIVNLLGDRAANEQRINDLVQLRAGLTDRAGKRAVDRALAQERIAGREGDNTLGAGFENGLDSLFLKVSDVSGGIERAMSNAFQGAEDALVSFVQTGEVSFSGLVDSMLADLTRLLARQAILALFNALSGGSGGAAVSIGTTLAGARANGGPVTRGEPYLVGEKGPEVFNPGQSGTITPNNALPAAAPVTNVTVVNFVDPEMVNAALNDPANQQVIVNIVGRNKRAIERMN